MAILNKGFEYALNAIKDNGTKVSLVGTISGNPYQTDPKLITWNNPAEVTEDVLWELISDTAVSWEINPLLDTIVITGIQILNQAEDKILLEKIFEEIPEGGGPPSPVTYTFINRSVFNLKGIEITVGINTGLIPSGGF